MKLAVALIVLSLMTMGCEEIKEEVHARQTLSRAELLERDLRCDWLPNMEICVCTYMSPSLSTDWGGMMHVPSHVCDGEENGATPR